MASSGVLNFTLGLATSQFTSALDSAKGKLGGLGSTFLKLTGVGAAIGAGFAALKGMANVVEGVMGAIEKGADLAHLSKRTGESVAALYSLQRGLKAVGLEAGTAGPMIFAMQRSLGGVNEEGLPTAHVFEQLGLSIEEIKKMDAPSAMQAIANSMARLDNSSAAAAASKIFGRGFGANFMQLARSGDEFSKALKGSAQAAQTMARNAQTFENVELALGRLKAKANGLFIGIAAGLAPQLEKILNQLNGIDLSGIGKEMGNVVSAFIQAFQEGRLSELISETLKLGFNSGMAIVLAGFAKLGVILLKTLETPLTYAQAGLDTFADRMLGVALKIRKFLGLSTVDEPAKETKSSLLANIERQHKSGKLSDDEYEKRKKEASTGTGFKEDSWQDSLKGRKEKGVEFFQPGYGLNEMGAGADDMLKGGMAKIKTLWGDYSKTIADFNKRAPKGQAVEDAKKGGGSLDATGATGASGSTKPSATSIEKMGFVFNGSAASDPNATTAKNTTKMVQQLGVLVAGKTNPLRPGLDALSNTHA